MRYVTPKEYWLSGEPLLRNSTAYTGTLGYADHHGNQTPFLLRFQGSSSLSPAGGTELATDHGGPLFPLAAHNFELPYIVLGGVLNSALRSVAATTVASGGGADGTLSQIQLTGVNFDTVGEWYSTASSIRSTSTDGITNLLLHGSRNLYDMLTRGGLDETGTTSEVYIVLTNDTANSDNCGVFRVIGAGTNAFPNGFTTNPADDPSGLVLQRVGVGSANLVGAITLTAEVRSQYTHTQDGSGTPSSEGASAVIVATDLSGTLTITAPSWQLTQPVLGQAVLDTSVLYGPSRGGTARVGDSIDTIGLVQTTASLVRNSPTTLDTTFAAQAGVPSGEYYFPSEFAQTWNRLPSLGLNAPYAPAYGGGTSSRYVADARREAEVFVDVGSKTLQIRPFQHSELSLEMRQISSGVLVPDVAPGSWPDTPLINAGNVFETSLQYGFEFPPEFMPRFGRQDIPFHQVPAGAAPTTGPVFYGINHLFGDSQSTTDSVFRIIGGPDNGGVATSPQSMFFVTGTTNPLGYGEYGTGSGLSTGGYKARLVEDVNVISADIPKGLNGIQLPPFLGVARVYGVYDLRDFAGSGSWNPDRVTPNPAAGLPANLLRTGVDKQTLYIMQGGAADVTGNADDHTYVIPSNIIDINRSASITAGQTFKDIEFVVECEIFGFARGFINKNNLVLVRNHLPDGSSGTVAAAIANNVGTILPLPLPYNDQLYAAYSRTVYQGDPFMTRDGATRNTADYENRYGQIPASQSAQLAIAIQQYNSNNDYSQVPEIPNARSLEILASADFWTTLGTGKVGGQIYAGTVLDPACIGTQGRGRIASLTTMDKESASDPIWQSTPRALSEGQGKKSLSGSLGIAVLQDAATIGQEDITFEQDGVRVVLTCTVDFTGADPIATAVSLTNAINNHATLSLQLGVRAYSTGQGTLSVYSTRGGSASNHPMVSILPIAGSNNPAVGITFTGHRSFEGVPRFVTSSHLIGGKDAPVNGAFDLRAVSPVKLGGMTERLPLGILVQDSDFLGEDPLRSGTSGLVVNLGGGAESATEATPLHFSDLDKTQEYGRIQGGGQLGMADGAVLRYDAWTLDTDTGVKNLRIFRGGGSVYTLEPTPSGGPVDFSLGEGWGPSSNPVLKGAALLGRAFLVRNYPETAFSSNSLRSHGDEVQMVIVTQAIYGEGSYADCGYTLDGQISPTGYGKGFAAADRYRIEGNLLVPGHSKAGENPNVELAPYPGEDAALPDDCP